MTYESDASVLRADLQDPNFTCYVYVGGEDDDGWQNALFVHGLVHRLNIYLFRDWTELKPWVGQKRPRGIAFGWRDDVKQMLSQSEAADLGVVVQAIAEAQVDEDDA
ncbi:MAG: hypothetical protein U1E73_03365 [Planctomycetota bacterium]